jgi:hypothetical protein
MAETIKDALVILHVIHYGRKSHAESLGLHELYANTHNFI